MIIPITGRGAGVVHRFIDPAMHRSSDRRIFLPLPNDQYDQYDQYDAGPVKNRARVQIDLFHVTGR